MNFCGAKIHKYNAINTVYRILNTVYYTHAFPSAAIY